MLIRDGWNMYYDIPPEAAVEVNSLEIRGRLTFYDPGIDPAVGPITYELESYLILVETGLFYIGK